MDKKSEKLGTLVESEGGGGVKESELISSCSSAFNDLSSIISLRRVYH